MYGVPAWAASDLPGPVRQKVDTSLAALGIGGDASKVAASIVDLCAANPGISLDIVAYAGEAAARADPSAQCVVSGTGCEALDRLMALLYDEAFAVAGEGVRIPAAAVAVPGGSLGSPPENVQIPPLVDLGGSPPGGIDQPPPPCMRAATCAEAPPVSQTQL